VEALEALPTAGVEVLDFFEERSAAFFALGRSRLARLEERLAETGRLDS